MTESTVVKTLTTLFGTGIVYMIGGIDLIFSVLLTFLVLDYVTGLMKAFINKDLSSSIGYAGLMKKVGVLIAIIVAHQVDKIAPGETLIRTAVITFFIANEGISLVENLSVIGVPVPDVLVRALKAWKDTDKQEVG